MTRNSKNEYSKNEYSKNGYEKSEYSKNQKNSRDCNHVKDREMSSYGQQNREQDEKDEYEPMGKIYADWFAANAKTSEE